MKLRRIGTLIGITLLATVTSAGAADILVVMYDPVGNLLWVRHIGGTGTDVSYDLVQDQSGQRVVLRATTAALGADDGRDQQQREQRLHAGDSTTPGISRAWWTRWVGSAERRRSIACIP